MQASSSVCPRSGALSDTGYPPRFRTTRATKGGSMGRAGGSASEKYERLSARHRAGLRQRLIVNLSVAAVLAAAFWIYASNQGMSFGPWVAGMILFAGAAKAIVEPDHIRAWGIGARGRRDHRPRARSLASAPRFSARPSDSRNPGQRRSRRHRTGWGLRRGDQTHAGEAQRSEGCRLYRRTAHRDGRGGHARGRCRPNGAWTAVAMGTSACSPCSTCRRSMPGGFCPGPAASPS